MAVTVRTYNLSAYWNTDTVLDTLQTALADVGYHAAAQTGTILTFTNSAGTTLAGQKGVRYLVKQTSTSGSGVNCTFDILRHPTTGAVSTVTLVNGGTGYAAANTIVIAGADIGGVTPTDNVTITVSTVSGSQGSTTTYYDKDTASPYTWSVCCVNNDVTKKMGQTYYSFHVPSVGVNTTLYIRAGAGFQSTTNVFNGVSGLDYYSTAAPNSTTQQHYSQVIASTNAIPITLKTFQSGLDPNFVIFQFSEVGINGSIYRYPFFLSKYNTAFQPWSLDDCFTGGIYEVGKSDATNTFDVLLSTQIAIAPLPKRQGEWGYNGFQSTYANGWRVFGYYESIYGKRFNTGTNHQNSAIYQRTLTDGAHNSLIYNPIIKGLPICSNFVPVPYFIPNDFIVAEVPGANNVGYGDTLTVSGSEIYTMLQFANNRNVTYNSALVFGARTT